VEGVIATSRGANPVHGGTGTKSIQRTLFRNTNGTHSDHNPVSERLLM
jgi:hypothetical protein